ncbi:tRNA (adenosine(37)-N6)-threonylcarbamoyltransferase complex dimerization subunit type 1 TsaB [Planctobacterium marinum]|uniref:tRNA (adenosine(37)-N6)-threonylcarbamoyltransferase complex dimerization subunit type 1 TsaB n=1 Tax=Planctobacterium marinum TaxID=1631968 RepID=UPI001E358408|nr:tRNA (adenosine(37)-N6)-threonylcarbamoyltransferase complex dimerization subunit type 1 TsaB [Planctobacterium marinum]MCC2607376.1 tRNA (adenosine(37)-N6)-threonylcarbamoyltransferase complex dimerization subunit type 1 TsaB [Planctobacterium marinum]
MNILAIDTATEACSVALETEAGIVSRFEVCPQEHSRKLLPMVKSVLEEASVHLQDLNALAVGAGPGSFTGVRIAMGMIQGLAYGASLPIVKVSTLQAMAQQAARLNSCSEVVALIDARMSEVYFGNYMADESGVMQLQNEELVISPEALLAGPLAGLNHYAQAGTGWQAYEALSALTTTEVAVVYPSAEFMLPMAKQLWRAGQHYEPANIEPTYLRDKVTWKKLPGR